VGCGGSGGSGGEALDNRATEIRERVTLFHARMNFESAASFELLLAQFPDAILGIVEIADDISDLQAAGYDVEPPADAIRYDPSRQPPSQTRYSVRVLRSVAGVIPEGDVIHVHQNGGVKNGVAYEPEGGRVLEVGKTYLLLLDPSTDFGWYWAAPWTKYEVGRDGRLTAITPAWADLAVPATLTGKTVDEAAALLAEKEGRLHGFMARGEVPLPNGETRPLRPAEAERFAARAGAAAPTGTP
jgi:hypothetical protein